MRDAGCGERKSNPRPRCVCECCAQCEHERQAGGEVGKELGRGRAAAARAVPNEETERLGNDERSDPVDDAAAPERGGQPVKHAQTRAMPSRCAMSLKKMRMCAIGRLRTSSLFMYASKVSV